MSIWYGNQITEDDAAGLSESFVQRSCSDSTSDDTTNRETRASECLTKAISDVGIIQSECACSQNCASAAVPAECERSLLANLPMSRNSEKTLQLVSRGDSSQLGSITVNNNDDRECLLTSECCAFTFSDACDDARIARTAIDCDEEEEEGCSESVNEERVQDNSSLVDLAKTDFSVLASSTTDDVQLYSWHSLTAIENRQYGTNAKQHSAKFRYEAMSSLHMVERMELMYKLSNHDGCVNSLNFNASGTRLASGSDDTFVCIWNWTTGQSLLKFETGHRSNVFQAKFMPLSGDCHIITCARDGHVRLAELSVRGVCKNIRKLAQHKGAAHKVSVENENPHVFLSCGEDAVVFEIDLRDPKPQRLLLCKDDKARKVPLYSIHHNPSNSAYFVVSGRDQFSRIYDRRQLRDNGPVAKFCPQALVNQSSHKLNVTCVVYNYNGREILATYNDDDIYTFDSSSCCSDNVVTFSHRYKGHRNNATVKGVSYFGAQSEWVVSGSDCGNIFFWHHDSEKIVQFMAADENGVVNCLEPHPSCPVLASSGLDHDVKVWIPSNEDPKLQSKLNSSEFREILHRNGEEREHAEDSDFMDSEMLWFIISRMRNASRRAAQDGSNANADESDSSSEEDAEDKDGEEQPDSDDDGSQHATQCTTS